MSQDDDSKAFSDFNRALELDSNHAITYYHRARLHEKHKAFGDALYDYTKALELNSDSNELNIKCNDRLNSLISKKSKEDIFKAIQQISDDEKKLFLLEHILAHKKTVLSEKIWSKEKKDDLPSSLNSGTLKEMNTFYQSLIARRSEKISASESALPSEDADLESMQKQWQASAPSEFDLPSSAPPWEDEANTATERPSNFADTYLARVKEHRQRLEALDPEQRQQRENAILTQGSAPSDENEWMSTMQKAMDKLQEIRTQKELEKSKFDIEQEAQALRLAEERAEFAKKMEKIQEKIEKNQKEREETDSKRPAETESNTTETYLTEYPVESEIAPSQQVSAETTNQEVSKSIPKEPEKESQLSKTEVATTSENLMKLEEARQVFVSKANNMLERAKQIEKHASTQKTAALGPYQQERLQKVIKFLSNEVTLAKREDVDAMNEKFKICEKALDNIQVKKNFISRLFSKDSKSEESKLIEQLNSLAVVTEEPKAKEQLGEKTTKSGPQKA